MSSRFFFSKKASSNYFISAVIISLVVLFVFLGLGENFFGLAKESTDFYQCKESVLLMSQPSSRATFFQGELLSSKGMKHLESFCPQEELELRGEAELLKDPLIRCWQKFGAKDFLPPSETGLEPKNLCVQCALFRSKEEIIEFEKELKESFNEEDISSLNSSSDNFVSLNTVIFDKKTQSDWIPDTLDSSKDYGLFFFIGRPSYECKTQGITVSECPAALIDYSIGSLAETGVLFSYLESSFGPSRESVGGVFIHELLDEEGSFEEKKLTIHSENGEEITCTQFVSPLFSES
jgi:hypothetical protein